MNKESIDKAFQELISKRGIHNKLGISSGIIRTYRFNLAKGITISTDAKLDILRKSQWDPGGIIYSRKDAISLLNFWKRTSQHARDMGPEYVIEKWEAHIHHYKNKSPRN